MNLMLDDVDKHRHLLEDKDKKPFLRHSNHLQKRRWRDSDLTEDEEAKRREEDIYHRKDKINGIDLSGRTPHHFDPNGTGRIHAYNIKYEVTDEDLKTLFGTYGRLKRAAVNYNSYGRSDGTAFIVFESKYSAVKAIQELNGKLLDGRILKLKLLNHSGQGCREPREVFKRKGQKRPVDGVNVLENKEDIRPEDLFNMSLDDYIQRRKRAKTWNYY